MHEKLIPEKNIFTILVGKNGTGKSTLLGNLASDFIKEVARNNKQHRSFEFESEDSYSSKFPNEIISVSTSPFDKFPLNRFSRQKKYTYLGLRDINSSSFGLGYLSKIISSLIESILKSEKQAYEICNVLEFLGYRDEMNIILEFNVNPHHLHDFLNQNSLIQEFDNRSNPIFRKVNRQFFANADDTLNERKLARFEKLIYEVFNNNILDKRHFSLSINRYGFEDFEINLDIESLVFLFEAGAVKLKDVLLNTIKSNERFSIKDASSGEQSIILSILGIASKIKDNCLILIDEPEICLHPQWQEIYIEILTDTFDKYKNCHFFIATHSPLIVSKLPYYNSFIVDLEKRDIHSSENYINNSVDFQLVNVFNNPGFKNEYLLRLAINTFARISKYKRFDDKDNENLQILSQSYENLKHHDPVFDLTKTLIQLKEMYG